jgi:predicted MFS family arabinose efflux permease
MGPAPSAAPPSFTGYQKFIVAVLAFVQFTVVLDFMILSPLGALLMKELTIPASRFGLVVSAYAFAAGASGFLAAGFADRFDRKRLLLVFYVGFVLGTLVCGLAPSYQVLLVGRVVTGFFAGVLGSVSFAIIADLFPPATRGRVMGVVQSAFAVSQVAGVPVGLLLSNHLGWHAPFMLIVAVSAVVGVVIALQMRPVDAHLAQTRTQNPLGHLLATALRGDYVRVYAATMLLVTGGFMLMPFASAFMVNNMGLPFERLPLVYIVTGAFAMVFGPSAGRLSDRVGPFPVFFAGTVISGLMVVAFTQSGLTPLWLVIVLNVVMMLGITGRIISASALTSMVPSASDRGAFMAVNASIQQLAGGVAAAVAGLIVTELPSGAIRHYDILGYVVIGAMMIVLVQLRGIDRRVRAARVAAPTP